MSVQFHNYVILRIFYTVLYFSGYIFCVMTLETFAGVEEAPRCGSFLVGGEISKHLIFPIASPNHQMINKCIRCILGYQVKWSVDVLD